MENNEILVHMEPERRRTFNFKENKVEVIELDELKRTYKENDVLGRPLRGMYHYEIIDKVADILASNGLQMEIDEIFAAQNNERMNPGVVVNPEIEKTYGENAIEAHVLRRIYANIGVRDFDTQELTTNVAIAFHQKGIEIAYGPMVRICHNQCIMSPERVFSTSRNVTIDEMIRRFSDCMSSFSRHIEEDKEFIGRMKMYPMTTQMIMQTIGMFEAAAVRYYTKDNRIKNRELYPLNLTQVNKFTEDMMIRQQELQGTVSLWDLYNVATNLYKADSMEIPMMFDQHLALNSYVNAVLA